MLLSVGDKLSRGVVLSQCTFHLVLKLDCKLSSFRVYFTVCFCVSVSFLLAMLPGINLID